MSVNLYSTSDQGRLHIAADTYYQGSIRYYENCLTQCLTILFGLACELKVGDKNYIVNKKSYGKFMWQHGEQLEARPSKIHTFAIETLCKDKGYMYEHLNKKKSNQLANELSDAIFQQNEKAVLRLLGEGANINYAADIVGRHPIDIPVLAYEGLYSTMPHHHTMMRVTPLLLACWVKNKCNRDNEKIETSRKIIAQILRFAPDEKIKGFEALRDQRSACWKAGFLAVKRGLSNVYGFATEFSLRRNVDQELELVANKDEILFWGDELQDPEHPDQLEYAPHGTETRITEWLKLAGNRVTLISTSKVPGRSILWKFQPKPV